MCIDDEPLVLRHLFVERPACGIGCMGLPVHATTAGIARGAVNGLNELTTNTFAAKLLRGEKVLEVAHVAKPRGTAMKEVVSEPDDVALALGDKGADRFAACEEAFPCCRGDLFGKRCRTDATVERVVAVPEGAPFAVVGAFYWAYKDRQWHMGGCV